MGALAFLADNDPAFEHWAAMAKESAGVADSAGDVAPISHEYDVPRWKNWEREFNEEDAYLDHVRSSSFAQRTKVASAAPTSDDYVNGMCDQAVIPAMPCRGSASFPSLPAGIHREKTAERLYPFNALVARPVSEAEIGRTPKATLAVKSEWDRLRDKNVWDETTVRDWHEVATKAQNAGEGGQPWLSLRNPR